MHELFLIELNEKKKLIPNSHYKMYLINDKQKFIKSD